MQVTYKTVSDDCVVTNFSVINPDINSPIIFSQELCLVERQERWLATPTSSEQVVDDGTIP